MSAAGRKNEFGRAAEGIELTGADMCSISELRYFEKAIERVKQEISHGFQHPAGFGYAQIELNDLEERYREAWSRCARYRAHELELFETQKRGAAPSA